MSSTGSLSTHWARQTFTLSRVDDALTVLQEQNLLSSFFDRLLEVLTLIEANESTMGFDTSLAWDMIERASANVLIYGESGAGKSLLVRTLTGNDGARSSATTVGTTSEHIYSTPCGVNFIDTPGIKIPLVHEADSSWSYLRDRVNWQAMLNELHKRLRSTSAATRPLAVVYVHRAATRVIPERIAELLGKSHALLVPTFLLLSDVCSVDDDALKEVRARMQAIAASLGPNARNHNVHVIEINTQTKVVSGHRHPSRGIPEFVSTLLTNLDPIDALTFTRRGYSLAPLKLVSAMQKARVRAARGMKRPLDAEEEDKQDDDNEKEAPPVNGATPVTGRAARKQRTTA